jgi:hypothetical protein
MDIKIFAVTISVLVLAMVLEMARREKISFKYAAGWIFISLTAIFFEVFDGLLFQAAEWFGFVLPSNFVFFVLLACFVFFSLFLTVLLYQQSYRINIMAQKVGLLELELKKIKNTSE